MMNGVMKLCKISSSSLVPLRFGALYQGKTVINETLQPKQNSFFYCSLFRAILHLLLSPVVSVSRKPSFIPFVSCFCKNGTLWPPTEKISLSNYRVFEN